MALFPENIDYESTISKMLRLFGYGEKQRRLLADGLVDAIALINDADRRARRTEAAVLAIAQHLEVPPEKVMAAMAEADRREREEAEKQGRRIAAALNDGGAS